MSANQTVVFTEPRRAVIEERSIPEPGPGEVLVKTRRSLISTGTELTIYSGEYPERSSWADYAKYPFIPGYSNVGQIVRVGDGVEGSLVGTRVASHAPHVHYATMRASHTFPLRREGVSDEEASFFTLAQIVMNGVRRSRLEWGEAVVVYGCGLLGQLAVRFARLLGARPVFAVDVAESRLGLLPKDSAILPLNPTRQDPVQVVLDHTQGRKADLVIELTGNQDLLPKEFACLRVQGRFLVLSSPRGPSQFDFHDLCNAPSYTIIGAHTSSAPKMGELDLPWTHARNTELFLNLIGDKEIDLRPLITHRASYADAPTFYNQLLEDRSQLMGVVFEWPD